MPRATYRDVRPWKAGRLIDVHVQSRPPALNSTLPPSGEQKGVAPFLPHRPKPLPTPRHPSCGHLGNTIVGFVHSGRHRRAKGSNERATFLPFLLRLSQSCGLSPVVVAVRGRIISGFGSSIQQKLPGSNPGTATSMLHRAERKYLYDVFYNT